MKTYKLPVRALSMLVLSVSVNSLVFAQKTVLPADLTEKSSLAEVFDWLDKTSLPLARIGLEANAAGLEPDEIPTASTRYYERAFFSNGFRLAKIDGCRLMLKHDDVKLIGFKTKYPNPADGSLAGFRKAWDNRNHQSKRAGEFSIPLQTLKANKAPFRRTKKAERADLLGIWQTEFKKESDFFLIPSKEKMKSVLANLLKIELVGAIENERSDSMDGDEITFTFDDKQTSEDFYAAFSRAITLCRDK